ncbi:MAG: ASKHA domain-containing protein [Eubacterium sp.]|nr:ASKHA domain-containing protein [Eubacterium sp.]MDD7209891.1 ASKHA domain-containing protein [Lachnospiraceae bacterium]MDY5496957.1 ASKHA domain-containing protein [Anaerobutyricum sp.]
MRTIRVFMGMGRQNLLQVLQKKGEHISASCGGIGVCKKCRVRFLRDAPEPTLTEKAVFTEKEVEEGWRLACETEIFGEVEIAIPDGPDEDSMVVESGFFTEGINSKRKAKTDSVVCNFGESVMAVDIGTTTIAASLVDPFSKNILKTVTGVNHQRAFGADVISRIHASNEGKGRALQRSILGDLTGLAGKLGVSFENTPCIISANTTMEHLLEGLSCKTLGVSPYKPVDVSLHTFKNMTLLPGISTFVGADIVSGIIACNMDCREQYSLLVDLGTNGEMVLGNREKMFVTSTAAGPAFEGGNISCGMAGIPGAICSVSLTENNRKIQTIGDEKPIGICGTGVLETVYELVKENYADETGLFGDNYFESGVLLAPGVVFTQKDIREVQLAKGAIRAGIEILMKEAEITPDEIERVYLAGGFGQKIAVDKAVGIGMIPKAFSGKIIAAGNSSLAGAVNFAFHPEMRERWEKVIGSSTEIPLALHPKFHDLYLKYMNFTEIKE